MPGLYSSLNVAVAALQTQQAALQVTTNNIANQNTPGYTRQVAMLTEADPIVEGSFTYGGGVTIQQYQSIRDQVLDLRIQQETTQQGTWDTQANALSQIETDFTSSTSDIGTRMSAFYSSLSALSASPSESGLRSSVLIAGQNLASEFNNVSESLTTIQTSMDQTVSSTVSQINQYSSEIATVNSKLASSPSGANNGTLQDQLGELELNLSKLTNINVTTNDNGTATVTTANGVPLVQGLHSNPLSSVTGSDGMQHVMTSDGRDITSLVSGGTLGGSIQVRDQVVPGLMSDLDNLASQVATTSNAVSQQGYDLNGTAGTNFFAVPDATTWNSQSVSSASASLSSGSFTIKVGSTSTAITVGGSSGINTVQQLADYIHTNTATLGIDASVVTDSGGVHLSLTGNSGSRFTVTSDSTSLGLGASGVAANLKMAITDTNKIAASSDGSTGSNGNLTNWVALQTSLYSGKSPTSLYSNLVGKVGSLSSDAQAQSSAVSTTLTQLNDQRSSYSGVSIDEEATNLVLYQQAYSAAARVVSTIDQLTSVVLNMGSGGGTY